VLVDLHHLLVVGGQEAGQPSAVAAGALHAPGDGLAEGARPGQQLPVAGGGGRDRDAGHGAAELIGGVGDVDLGVGVDADGELRRGGVCDAGDGRLLSVTGRGGTRAGRADSTVMGLATGSYQVTFVRLACRWGRGSGRQVPSKAPGQRCGGSGPPRPPPTDHRNLILTAVWDEDGVRDDLRAYVVEHLGDHAAVLVVDETGDLKKGSRRSGRVGELA
jgi:hypothetical protein